MANNLAFTTKTSECFAFTNSYDDLNFQTRKH